MKKITITVLLAVASLEIWLILSLIGVYAAPVWGVPSIIDPISMRLIIVSTSAVTFSAGWICLSLAVGVAAARRLSEYQRWFIGLVVLVLAAPTALVYSTFSRCSACEPYPNVPIERPDIISSGYVQQKGEEISRLALRFTTLQMVEPAAMPGGPQELERCFQISQIESNAKEILRAAGSLRCTEYSDLYGEKLRCDRTLLKNR